MPQSVATGLFPPHGKHLVAIFALGYQGCGTQGAGASGVATTGKIAVTILAAGVLSACSGGFGRILDAPSEAGVSESVLEQRQNTPIAENESRETIWDLFLNTDDPNVTIEVNKYIWNATLDILDFMPVEAADPFSGVIVFGFGTPPGSNRAYRATVYVQDPALDARSLRLALVSRSGPASLETIRAIEDAILTRARQLRLADAEL